jgi:hypothetical protein
VGRYLRFVPLLPCSANRCVPPHTHAPTQHAQIALDQAEELLNIAAAGEEGGGYDSIRQQLAEAYQQGGLGDVADFIKAA